MKAQRTTSLLFSGGQTVASVGNPGDTQKYDVKALVIGTKTKVPGLEDVPNFAELDMDSALDEISMWRGYAVKKGAPASMIEWFQNICDKVSALPNGSIVWQQTSLQSLQIRLKPLQRQ